MKKQYIRPAMLVSKFEITTYVCDASVGLSSTYANKNSEGLGKDRGSRSESDDFDDLW